MQENLDASLDDYFQRKEDLKVWHGSCEVDNDPDYELLKRHFEVWCSRHPEQLAEFLVYRKEQHATNLKDTGASESNEIRLAAGIPPKIFTLFSLLSPNFLGAKEITPDARRKRLKKFLKEFPIFRMHKKS